MKKIACILFFNLNLLIMSFAQDHDYIKTGNLPDYSRSRAYSYIAYLDRLLKKDGYIEKMIASGDTDRAKRILSNLDLNINNVKEADADYPLDGFIAKCKMLEAQVNGGATATTANTSVSDNNNTTTKPVATNVNPNEYKLPDYSKSPAYSTIQYLDGILKPGGKIDGILKDGDFGRAENIAKGTTDHINTLKKTDSSYPASVFEYRQQELLKKANKGYGNMVDNAKEKENLQKELGEKSSLVGYLIINSYHNNYFSTSSNAKMFVDRLNQLDWQNTKKQLAKATQKYPDWANSFSYLRSFEADFLKQQNADVAGGIQETIDYAYERKQYSTPEALEWSETALKIADACLTVLPNHNETQNLKKQAQAAVDKFGPNYPTTFHKEHAGEILFASQAINSTASITPKPIFKAGEHIYAMAYFKGVMKDFTYSSDKAAIELEKDGTFLENHLFRIVSGQNGDMFLYIEILPETNSMKHMSPEKFAKKLSTISPRKHEIGVRLTIGGTDVATGKFTIDASGGAEPIAALHKAYRAKNAANVFLQKSKRNDAQLEKDMVKAFNETGWKQTGVRATIYDAEWRTVTQHVTGKILYRAIRGQVSAKDPDGDCMLYLIDFMQDYQGNGKYSSHTKVHQSDDMRYMDCKNLNVVK
ncbi:MAG: hypothetical protein GY810_17960 [Aureispira sp.]|nr:hypothetical protein [Aureispira sp.]